MPMSTLFFRAASRAVNSWTAKTPRMPNAIGATTSTGPVAPFSSCSNIPAVCEDVGTQREAGCCDDQREERRNRREMLSNAHQVLLGRAVLYRQEDRPPLLHLAVEAI